MRPYDARSSVTLEKLGFVVREPQSHLELTYFLPKISAFMLISGNWANRHIRTQTSIVPSDSQFPAICVESENEFCMIEEKNMRRSLWLRKS